MTVSSRKRKDCDIPELIKVAKAISDENRLKMLKLLTEKDICICEMRGIFSLSHSQISRNLSILYDAGFLKRWNEGKRAVYIADRINSSKCCQTIIDLIADSFNKDVSIHKLRVKLQKVIEDKVRS